MFQISQKNNISLLLIKPNFRGFFSYSHPIVQKSQIMAIKSHLVAILEYACLLLMSCVLFLNGFEVARSLRTRPDDDEDYCVATVGFEEINTAAN